MTTEETRTAETVQNMCGGKGHVIIERLLDDEQLNGKCGLYANVKIEKDCSLGYHEHHGESETYYILNGEGDYDDNGKTVHVKKGDVVFCPSGSGHALENTGDQTLEFMALIIKG